MENLNALKLFNELQAVDDYKKVNEILLKYNFITNKGKIQPVKKNWKVLGGDKHIQIASVHNQQSDSKGAIVEKITNCIDAIVKNDVKSKQIKAKSFNDAVQTACNDKIIKNKIIGIQNFEKQYDLFLVATGDKDDTENTALSFIDRGIGQPNSDFEKTFLSINQGYKMEQPDQHGQFHMGGLGALTHSVGGTQLIISKRNPEFNEYQDEKNMWSFTIIKEFTGDDGMPIFYYLIIDNKIPNFNVGSLPIIPKKHSQKDIRRNGTYLEYGTLVKNYSYKLPWGCGTVITSNLKYNLNHLLPSIPFPINFLELRKGYNDGKNRNSKFIGLEEQLVSSDLVEWEDEPFNVGGVKVKVIVTKRFTKKNADKDDKETRVLNEARRCIHKINYQTHYIESTTVNKYIDNHGLSFIKNSIIFIVDYSNLSMGEKLSVFQANRESVKKTSDIYNKVMYQIDDYLRDSKELKRIKNKRKNEMDSSEPESLEKMFTEDFFVGENTLSSLNCDNLISNFKNSDMFVGGMNDENGDENESKTEPTYLDIKDFINKYKETPKLVKSQGKFSLKFLMDNDDYVPTFVLNGQTITSSRTKALYEGQNKGKYLYTLVFDNKKIKMIDDQIYDMIIVLTEQKTSKTIAGNIKIKYDSTPGIGSSSSKKGKNDKKDKQKFDIRSLFEYKIKSLKELKEMFFDDESFDEKSFTHNVKDDNKLIIYFNKDYISYKNALSQVKNPKTLETVQQNILWDHIRTSINGWNVFSGKIKEIEETSKNEIEEVIRVSNLSDDINTSSKISSNILIANTLKYYLSKN